MIFNNKKANVTGYKQIEFIKEDISLSENNNIIIEIKSSAICGGDKKAYTGDHPFVDYPIFLGHEISGEVVDTRGNVTTLSKGEKVTIEPAVNCGNCINCRMGNYNFCDELTFLYRQGKAGMAKYIEVAEDKAYKISDELGYDEAALIEPLAVAVHAWQKVNNSLTDKVAIIGSGTIGLLLTQLAVINGVKEVTVFGLKDFKLNLAAKFGATNIINNSQNYNMNNEHDNYDKVFEAVGINQTLDQSLELIKQNGEIILVGLYKNDVTIDMNKVIKKEVKLLGSQGYCWNFDEAIYLAESKKIKLKPLITHCFSLENITEALEVSIDSKSNAIKVICNIN